MTQSERMFTQIHLYMYIVIHVHREKKVIFDLAQNHTYYAKVHRK